MCVLVIVAWPDLQLLGLFLPLGSSLQSVHHQRLGGKVDLDATSLGQKTLQVGHRLRRPVHSRGPETIMTAEHSLTDLRLLHCTYIILQMAGSTILMMLPHDNVCT